MKKLEVDLLKAHSSQADPKILHCIQQLPYKLRVVVEAKYRLNPEAIDQVSEILQKETHMQRVVAQGVVLNWVHHKHRPPLHSLSPLISTHLQSMRRKCRASCSYLDGLNIKALTALEYLLNIDSKL